MKKFATLALGFSVLFALAFSTPPSARADGITSGTDYYMTVNGYPSGENDGTYYIGYASITISDLGHNPLATFTDAFCVDFNHDISVPITYEVKAVAVDPNSGIPDEQAWLGEQFTGNATTDTPLQHAIWQLSDGAAGFTTTDIQTLMNQAGTASATYNLPGMFEFDASPGTGGQNFQAYDPPAATPEPSSLLLLGTGILGIAGAFKRRLNLAGR